MADTKEVMYNALKHAMRCFSEESKGLEVADDQWDKCWADVSEACELYQEEKIKATSKPSKPFTKFSHKEKD